MGEETRKCGAVRNKPGLTPPQLSREWQVGLSAFMEASIDGFIMLNERLNLLGMNPAAERLLGLSKKAARTSIGKGIKDLIPDAGERVTYGRYRKVMRTGEPFITDIIFPHPQFGDLNLSVKSFRVGRGLGMIVSAITARKQMEADLRESEEKYRQLVEKMQEGLWGVDRDACTTFVNPRMAEMLGCTVEEMQGQPMFHFMAQRTTDICKHYLERCKQGVKEGHDFEFIRKNGTRVYASLEASPIVNDDGNYVGAIASVADISERKQAQEELQRSYGKLQRAMERTKQAFALTTEMREPYTFGHQRRVTKLACAIASEMGVFKEQIEGIDLAGSIHDIGKMYVPTEILCKAGQLTEVEFSLIKVHPQAGHDILRTVEFTGPIAQIVLQHHERLDGSGYPSGLSGEDILLEARILAVADVVEAMSSHRPYRPGYVVDKALLEIVQKRGVLYDRNVVDACMTVFAEKGFKFH